RVIKDNILFFNMFNMSRIHFFQLIIWYVCLALALVIIWKYIKFGHFLASLVLIAQLTVLFSLNEEKKYSDFNMLTYNEFYSVELFDEIKDYIGKDPASYRIVNIALHSAIAEYKGFYNFDTYNNRLPLTYNHNFKKSNKTNEEYRKDTEAHEDMGGYYVFCALPIENAEETGLELENTFENEPSPWRIYLYSIKE